MTDITYIESGREIIAYKDGRVVGTATGREERIRGRVTVPWSVNIAGQQKGRGYTKAQARSHLKKLTKQA